MDIFDKLQRSIANLPRLKIDKVSMSGKEASEVVDRYRNAMVEITALKTQNAKLKQTPVAPVVVGIDASEF